jgi:hypothetical protein
MNTGSRNMVIACLIAVVVAAGVWLLWRSFSTDEGVASRRPSSLAVSAEQVEAIVGRWRRPDGGYILEIRGLDASGDLEVGYFNPQPINVSQAQVVRGSRGLNVFVELRDQNYPGATYRLDYDTGRDVLVGVYHQPAINQSFEVYFVRAE